MNLHIVPVQGKNEMEYWVYRFNKKGVCTGGIHAIDEKDAKSILKEERKIDRLAK